GKKRLSVGCSNVLRFWASRFRFSTEDWWGTTVRKSPIGSTNHQWGMKKPPLMEVSLYKLLFLNYIFQYVS
ncbi:hypothetical protein, partial [Bacillus rhizoplanae]|uniref:hypothetical protein n=1 Tax=Bacillus rhizoplanae TaxID=2880966 RepID=UPI003D1DCE97